MVSDPRLDDIRFLIKNRYAGSFTYQGLPRTFSPYLLGVTQDQRLVLHAFQWQGESSKGPVTPETGAWRFFYLDQVEGVVNAVFGVNWYPTDLRKSTELTVYKPPKFITEVLSLVELPE